MELERLWNHLNDVAAVCAGVGMAAGSAHFLALTEQARRLNAALTGHRFLAATVEVGRSRLRCDLAQVMAIREELAHLRAAVEVGWRALSFNRSFQDRLVGVGVLDGPMAARLGVVGPSARAAGLTEDVRARSSLPDYEGFAAAVTEDATGDVRARLAQRKVELAQTFDLLERSLGHGPLAPAEAMTSPGDASTALPATDGALVGVGIVESPRGATSCVIEASGGTISRVRLRTGSYANWPAVAEAAADSMLPDFPLINKSFELCYACSDR